MGESSAKIGKKETPENWKEKGRKATLEIHFHVFS